METPTSAGWFDDPEDDQRLRYFDGVVWTKHTTPRSTRPSPAATAQQPPAQPGPPQASGWQPPNPQSSNPQFPGTPQSGQWNAPQGQSQPYPGQQSYPGQSYPGQQYPGQQSYPGQQPPGQGAPWNAPAYGGLVTGPTTPDGQPLATFWQRVGAYLIDGILQFLLVVLLAGWLLVRALGPVLDEFRTAIETNDPSAFETINTANLDYGSLIAFALASAAIQFAYTVLFLSRTGATPGKALLGLSVRLRDRPGVPSFAVAARRTSVQTGLSLLSNIPVLGNFAGLAALLDLLWPAWDDKKQALHDKVAATNVVKGKQPR